MATEWFYAKDGQEHGPVSAQALKELAQSGELRPEHHVWSESLKDWTPVSRVPALAKLIAASHADNAAATATLPASAQPAPAAQPQPGASEQPQGVLSYEAPSGEAMLFTPACMEDIRITRPWTIFIAVISFIGCGLIVLSGVVTLASAMMSPFGGGIGVGIALLYFAIAGLFIAPSVQLCKFAARIADLQRLRRSRELEAVTASMRKFWRGISIAIIIYLIVIVVLIGIIMLSAMM